MDNPELIQAKEIQVWETMNRLVQSMGRDIDNFKHSFQNMVLDTQQHVQRSVSQQEQLKLPLKPELTHQYGILFNHHGYMVGYNHSSSSSRLICQN